MEIKHIFIWTERFPKIKCEVMSQNSLCSPTPLEFLKWCLHKLIGDVSVLCHLTTDLDRKMDRVSGSKTGVWFMHVQKLKDVCNKFVINKQIMQRVIYNQV